MACAFFLAFSLFFQFLFYIRHLSGAHHFLCDCVFSHNHVKLFQHGQTFWVLLCQIAELQTLLCLPTEGKQMTLPTEDVVHLLQTA